MQLQIQCRRVIINHHTTGVDISEVPGCHLIQWMSSQWGLQKLLQGLVSHELTSYLSVFNPFLTQWIMAILSKGSKPDNFEPHNSVKRPSFQFCWIWSFLESNSPDILALCETNFDDSIDSGNFSFRGYLPLIRKDSITHMHGLADYVKEEPSFVRDLSLVNSADSYLCFRLTLLHSKSSFFSICWSLSSLLCTIFYSISSNIDEVPLINSSANVFVFGEFNVHHKDYLTYSVGTDRAGKLCHNFSISNNVTQIVNFPTRIPDCDSHGPALLDLFLSSDTSICSTMAFPPLGNSGYVFVSVSIDFSINSKQDALVLRDVPWEDILNFSAFPTTNEFCQWVQLRINCVYPLS